MDKCWAGVNVGHTVHVHYGTFTMLSADAESLKRQDLSSLTFVKSTPTANCLIAALTTET